MTPISTYQFPNVRRTHSDTQLIAQGADLSPATILTAYRAGLFPWFSADEPILWWSPNPRCIIDTKDYHPSASLLRTLKTSALTLTINTQFSAVMLQCRKTREATGTWISDDMIAGYTQLFELGYGYSIEVWQNTQLVGGLYGLHIAGATFGESMFSHVRDASKIAFCYLMYCCQQAHIPWVDCQVESPHILSLGAHLISRDDYLNKLDERLQHPSITLSQEPLGTRTLHDYFRHHR